MHYVGLDIHKRTIRAEIKDDAGRTLDARTIKARRPALRDWARQVPQPFSVAFEATLFTGWVYDEMIKYTDDVKVGNPQLLHYISKGKKKSDKIDASKLADLLRVDMIPETYMLPEDARTLRDLLRYRHWLVRQCTRFKNKITGQLMMYGLEYDGSKIHGKGYFRELAQTLEADKRLIQMLQFSRGQLDMLTDLERKVRKLIYSDPALVERVELLTTIPGVGEITALTWALEVWDPNRFSNHKRAVSFCGLCSAYRESAGKQVHGPLSKKRNKHLQWILVEASKIAVHRLKDPKLVAIYEKVKGSKHKNAATIAVARHLVKWLLAVDKRKSPFRDSA